MKLFHTVLVQEEGFWSASVIVAAPNKDAAFDFLDIEILRLAELEDKMSGEDDYEGEEDGREGKYLDIYEDQITEIPDVIPSKSVGLGIVSWSQVATE